MFGVKFNPTKNTKPLKTIEREVEQTRARYQHYLKTGEITLPQKNIVKESFSVKVAKFLKSLIKANK